MLGIAGKIFLQLVRKFTQYPNHGSVQQDATNVKKVVASCCPQQRTKEPLF